MRGFLVISSLFALGFGLRLAKGIPTDETDTLVYLFLIFAPLGAYFFYRSQAERDRRLLQWLAENSREIQAGGSRYNNYLITPDTILHRFTSVVSVLILSLKVPSRWVIAGESKSAWVQWLNSLTSLIFGWWGIPWGPIWTLRAIFNNTRGGERLQVRDLLASP